MENLYKIARQGLFVVFFVMIIDVFAQDDFYVYKFEGIPYLEVNDSIKPIVKGMAISKVSLLTLNKQDVVHFISKNGDEYIIEQPGSYQYGNLFEFSKKNDSSSFAKKYLTYLWKNYTNSIVDTRSKSGVVYRGDDILLMQYPADSAKVIGAEVCFQWNKIEEKEKNYYLILKEVETGKVIIIGTPAISVSLTVDDYVLKPGSHYEWTIAETKYPNLDKVVFFKFEILTKEAAEILTSDIKSIMKYLGKQGLTASEIQHTLCEAYKLCY